MEKDTVGWRRRPLGGSHHVLQRTPEPWESLCPWWGWGVADCSPLRACWGSLPGPLPTLYCSLSLGVSSPCLSCCLHCPPR